MRHTLFTLATSSLLCLSFSAAAQDLSPTQQRVADALKMDYRTEAERARDDNRDAVNALEFIGLEEGMTVVEFFPARQAWYTKILAPVLGEGELYLIDSERTFNSWGDLLDNPVFDNTHKVMVDAGYNRQEGRYEIGEIDLPVKAEADVFMNIREYHNFNNADKTRLNKTAFDALKSGGRYVIIDHTRRHNQPETRTLGRREDPVQVILEVQDAGFELEKASGMFFRENDELNLEVGNDAVTGQTDRFFLVFKKP